MVKSTKREQRAYDLGLSHARSAFITLAERHISNLQHHGDAGSIIALRHLCNDFRRISAGWDLERALRSRKTQEVLDNAQGTHHAAAP
jgi:hypothetical protein